MSGTSAHHQGATWTFWPSHQLSIFVLLSVVPNPAQGHRFGPSTAPPSVPPLYGIMCDICQVDVCAVQPIEEKK